MVIFSARPPSLEYFLPLLFIQHCSIFFKALILADVMFIKYSVVYLLSPALLLVWDASYLRAGTEAGFSAPHLWCHPGSPEPSTCPTGMC